MDMTGLDAYNVCSRINALYREEKRGDISKDELLENLEELIDEFFKRYKETKDLDNLYTVKLLMGEIFYIRAAEGHEDDNK